MRRARPTRYKTAHSLTAAATTLQKWLRVTTASSKSMDTEQSLVTAFISEELPSTIIASPNALSG
jgi:Flp pilus assembly protein TadG